MTQKQTVIDLLVGAIVTELNKLNENEQYNLIESLDVDFNLNYANIKTTVQVDQQYRVDNILACTLMVVDQYNGHRITGQLSDIIQNVYDSDLQDFLQPLVDLPITITHLNPGLSGPVNHYRCVDTVCILTAEGYETSRIAVEHIESSWDATEIEMNSIDHTGHLVIDSKLNVRHVNSLPTRDPVGELLDVPTPNPIYDEVKNLPQGKMIEWRGNHCVVYPESKSNQYRIFVYGSDNINSMHNGQLIVSQYGIVSI